MDVFGSPQALTRAPPLLVFVIDVAAIGGGQLSQHLSTLELIVTRTLLYYFLHVDNRLAWTFQLFHSRLTQPIKRIPQRMPSEFSFETLRQFSQVLRKFAHQCSEDLSANSSDENKRMSSNLSSVRSALEWGIQDMKWDWNTSIARMQGALLSPPQRMKTFDKLTPLTSYKVRNYLFLISSLPRTLEEAGDYFSTDAPTSWSDVANSISDVLFGRNPHLTPISIGLVEKRCSLSMVDLSDQTEVLEKILRKYCLESLNF